MAKKIFYRNTSLFLASLKSKKFSLLMKVGCFSSLLLGTVYLPPLANYRELATASTVTSKKAFVGYFQSWSDKTANRPEQLQLANIAPYVNVVIRLVRNINLGKEKW
ncbi:hypothetical protein H6G64_34575 [Calothrix sp. FACHB-156]|nr:hypothetical protein [Calothrix sp. FACHB-156]